MLHLWRGSSPRRASVLWVSFWTSSSKRLASINIHFFFILIFQQKDNSQPLGSILSSRSLFTGIFSISASSLAKNPNIAGSFFWEFSQESESILLLVKICVYYKPIIICKRLRQMLKKLINLFKKITVHNCLAGSCVWTLMKAVASSESSIYCTCVTGKTSLIRLNCVSQICL